MSERCPLIGNGHHGSSVSDGPVVATNVAFSSLGKGRGVLANAREIFVADDAVVLADR